ncbi:BGTF surface domain-containing protein [Halosegnis marinus]|uniref:BGTF surface domain-containing protein n=1 Tax=Halosegnis marinus TaxID=3034023 RepID=A0ABD5ZQG2_9EURY|nr:BGTF surface domain-containing protein [Halosegnis sp. DT85]
MRKVALLLTLAVLVPLTGCNALGGGATATPTATETPTATATATPVEGTSLDYDGDALTLANTTDQRVTGVTDLADGTEVTVRLRASGDSPFLHTDTATVENGTFAATFDLSNVPADTNFVATVTADEVVAETDGEVVAA